MITENDIQAIVYREVPPTEHRIDLPYVTHEGVLKIGEHEIKSYILSNGERVFDADDFERFYNNFFADAFNKYQP
jgi:hypothetical protein